MLQIQTRVLTVLGRLFSEVRTFKNSSILNVGQESVSRSLASWYK